MRRIRQVLLACALALIAAGTPSTAAQTYDLLLSGGEVLDGTGAPAYRADVAIVGDRLAAIGDLPDASAHRTIDASGLTIVPGFVDLHSHADGIGEAGGLRSRDARRRAAPNLVSQGITTVVVNQDGRSPSNIAGQIELIREGGIGPNAIVMVGHNTVRRIAMQGTDKQRPSNPEEIDTMRALVREGMDAGAWGLTAGLEYEPGIWSTTGELIALVEEVRPYGGIYIVHERASGVDPMWYLPSRDRSYTPTTMADNIREVIRVAETTGVPTVATHIKARGVEYWGKADELIALIEAARERGVPVYADQYPYDTSGSDGTITLLPPWIVDQFSGSRSDFRGALRAVLSDEQTAKNLALDVLHQIGRRGGPANIVVIDHPNPEYIGRTLAELMADLGVNPVEMTYVLQLEGYADRLGGAILRGFSLNEEDIRRFVVQPWTITASDAGISLPGEGFIHARYYGTFPRKIRKYALDEGLISVEQAVHSMTGLPADILGLHDRGRLREGAYADIAVLDLDTVRDTATFFEPHQYAEGIPYVLVNGEFVVDGGHRTLRLPGRVLTPGVDRDPAHTDD